MHFLALLALALPVFAAVTPGRRATSDLEALSILLTLGELENAVFDQGLGRFTQADFVKARLPQFTRGRFAQIRQHIEIHLAFLKQAITDSGSAIVQPCTYALPLENPQSLVRTGVDIETIVASAYNGAMGLVENNDYRVALASIYGPTSRQAGWLNSAVLKESPWNTAFDVPLTFRQAWTSVQKYISSCPLENARLFPSGPLDPFSQLYVVGTLTPGSTGHVKFDEMESFADRPLYVAFKTGVGEIRTRLGTDGAFEVSKDVADRGAIYIFIISNEDPITDDNIIAGPILINFSSSSYDTSF